MSGIKELQSVPREVMDAAFKVIQTTQKVRIGGKPGLSSKDVDNNLINSGEDIFKQEEMTSEFLDKAKTLLGFAKVPASAIIKFNEGLISKPDTMVARPLFIGAFNKSFESMRNLTGLKLLMINHTEISLLRLLTKHRQMETPQ